MQQLRLSATHDKPNHSLERTGIQGRIESKQWSSEIASRVIRRRNKYYKKLSAASAAASLAAAILLIVFQFIPENTDNNKFERMISAQLNGTYNAVFETDYKTGVSSTSSENLQYDDIDIIIDNTLAMR